MLRLRLQLTGWPRRTLILTDTPRPDCPDCEGDGGIGCDYGDHEGEYAGTDWYPCPCWTEWRMTLLSLPRLPRLLHRRPDHRDPWSGEPPF